MLDEQVQFVVCSTKQQMDGKHAKELAERMRRKGKRVMAYRCPHCGKWHIGGKR